MVRTAIALTSLLILFLVHTGPGRARVMPERPDLKIKQYEFVATNDKWVRVEIANDGKAASGPCQLELAVSQD